MVWLTVYGKFCGMKMELNCDFGGKHNNIIPYLVAEIHGCVASVLG